LHLDLHSHSESTMNINTIQKRARNEYT